MPQRSQNGIRPLSTNAGLAFQQRPLGTDTIDKDGQDVVEASRPKEFAELSTLLRPRGERIFFGAWDLDDPPIE